MRKLASESGVSAMFHGHVTGNRKMKFIEQADVAIIPSRPTVSGQIEGTPTVLLEYMAAGIPVIASGTGGITDLGHHGTNCLISKPGCPDDLAKQIIHLLGNRELAIQLQAGGHKTASQNDWRSISYRFQSTIKDQCQPNST
ncbi:glycosyltransferase family 4 protein [bacterium]|nr:glycosyltransferase family 4 protein [bacterium]